MRLQYGPFHYYDLPQIRTSLSWFYAKNNNPSKKSGIQSCISYRITNDINVMCHNNIINNWVNEQFAVLLYCNVYTHMHGLIFETSIWLLAGSTRFSFNNLPWHNPASMSHKVVMDARSTEITKSQWSWNITFLHDSINSSAHCKLSNKTQCGSLKCNFTAILNVY